ncbi:MAG: hypothetical protein ABI895_05480 [Deltaproteobacteria bacterium]
MPCWLNMVVWVIWFFSAGAWQKSEDTYPSKATCEQWARMKAETAGSPMVCRKDTIAKPPPE